MKRMLLLGGLALVFTAALAPTAASAQPARVSPTPNGKVLETPAGKTLYVFDGDKIDLGQRGKSSCNGECAANWPPFSAGLDAQPIGNWTIISREDGKRQWAYKGRPLYTWSKDLQPGQMNGEGYDGNSWHVAHP